MQVPSSLQANLISPSLHLHTYKASQRQTVDVHQSRHRMRRNRPLWVGIVVLSCWPVAGGRWPVVGQRPVAGGWPAAGEPVAGGGWAGGGGRWPVSRWVGGRWLVAGGRWPVSRWAGEQVAGGGWLVAGGRWAGEPVSRWAGEPVGQYRSVSRWAVSQWANELVAGGRWSLANCVGPLWGVCKSVGQGAMWTIPITCVKMVLNFIYSSCWGTWRRSKSRDRSSSRS